MEVKNLTNGELKVEDLLTTKNISVASAFFGFYLGTKTPGYVDRQLEAFGQRLGGYIREGIEQRSVHKDIAGASGADPLETLYSAISVLAEKQGETLELLRKYMPQAVRSEM